MGKSRIMWDNAVARSTIAASSEDAGYPVSNIATWRETSIWKASGANSYEIEFELDASAGEGITSLCIMAHNLHTCGARYKLEGSNDGSSIPSWNSIVAYQTPTNDYCQAHQFNSVNYPLLKLTIDNNGGGNFTPQIGIVFIGEHLEIPRNPDPNGLDPDSCEEIGDTQVSESGLLLGESIAFVKRNPSFSYPYLTPAFIADDWIPFRQTHRGLPFFWMWDSDIPTETYFMKFSGKTVTQPYNQVLFRSLQFSLEGRKEQ